jgi:hypothetical protein
MIETLGIAAVQALVHLVTTDQRSLTEAPSCWLLIASFYKTRGGLMRVGDLHDLLLPRKLPPTEAHPHARSYEEFGSRKAQWQGLQFDVVDREDAAAKGSVSSRERGDGGDNNNEPSSRAVPVTHLRERFSCPFWKHDPVRWSTNPICGRRGWETAGGLR